MRWTDSILIDAPTDLVWLLTTDITGWHAYTPTVQSVERLDDGALRVGSRARIKQPGQRPAVWTVTRLDDVCHEFRWQTHRRGLSIIGSHRVHAEGAGCSNTLELEATGPLARPFALLVGPLLRRALRTENTGLKTEAQRLRSQADESPIPRRTTRQDSR
jgi:hypothetical protein